MYWRPAVGNVFEVWGGYKSFLFLPGWLYSPRLVFLYEVCREEAPVLSVPVVQWIERPSPKG